MRHTIIYGAPGCGKTHYLTQQYISCHEYHDVLMTTFRKDTADEIRHKISDITGVAPYTLKPNINTIHGICYGLLGGPKYAEVIKDKDIRDFNKETGFNFKLQNNATNPENGNDVLDCYAWSRNTNTPLNKVTDYPNFPKLKLPSWVVREQIEVYETWKQENGKIDFTDMLTEVLRCG